MLLNKLIIYRRKKNNKWFETYEKTGKYDENNWLINEKIEFAMSALNRRKYLKFYGWKIYIPNLIPANDFIYIIKNYDSNEKIINYFLKKIEH